MSDATDSFSPDVHTPVRALPIGDLAVGTRARYEAEFGEPPEQPGGWYRPDDWRRVSFVLDQLRSGANVLDVGAGAGQFANAMAASGRFQDVVALDHVRFGKYREFHELITRHDASIAELPFDDDSFDVVTCMEVLEHVPDEVFLPGLAELRRVCRGQLVMSIPFREAEPLSKGHLRRFDAQDVDELFPEGRFAVLERPRMPWMIIVEHLDGTPVPDFVVPEAPESTGSSGSSDETELTRDQRRIRHLETELARLRARKAIRAADWLGARARGARRRVRSTLGRG